MERNYEEFNFIEPLSDQEIDRINVIFSKTIPNRIIDWRDNQTVWIWKEGKTLEDGEWE